MMMLAAVQRPRVASFTRWMNAHGVQTERLEQLHKAILEALASGPLARREIHEKVEFYKGLPMVGWGLDAMGLAFEGKIVLSHQAAANTAFVRLDHWLPSLSRCQLSEEEALKELMRRYFATYGPANYSDFLYWAGVKVGFANKAFHSVRDELDEVTLEGRKGAYFTFDSPASEGTGMPLRLLPKFDVLMMGHKDKSLFLPEKLKPMVFRKAGQVEAVVLADGQVRGTWRTARKGNVLEFTIEPYVKFKKAWEKQLPKEAERVAKALGFDSRVLGF
jgi:Winged helix DNA-binding domain